MYLLVSMSAPWASSAQGGQKRASEPLELELQVVVRHMWELGIGPLQEYPGIQGDRCRCIVLLLLDLTVWLWLTSNSQRSTGLCLPIPVIKGASTTCLATCAFYFETLCQEIFGLHQKSFMHWKCNSIVLSNRIFANMYKAMSSCSFPWKEYDNKKLFQQRIWRPWPLWVGEIVQGTVCSSRGPRFQCQHPYHSSQPFVTSALGYLAPSQPLWALTWTHRHTDIYSSKTPSTYIK